MRVLLATDAWEPQVNGVVRTLNRTVAEMRAMGHEVEIVSPDQFKTLPMPTYPEIRLALGAYEPMQERFKSFEPEAIHIATEGPVGLAARRLCLDWKLPFTTSYHTRFPEYLAARVPVPVAGGYAYMRWFHQPSGRVMVATPTMRDELERRGFRNLSPWTRGVDTELFRPRQEGEPDLFAGLERPIFLNVGRVAPEKNIEAFLQLDLPGTKVVVGDGPGPRGASGPISRGQVPGGQVRVRAGGPLRGGRRLRLPVPDRHLRPGDIGGHGGRDAGGRLSGAGAG